jgi:hypothetical protein
VEGNWLIAVGAFLSGVGSCACGYVALRMARREKESARDDGRTGAGSDERGSGSSGDLRVVPASTDDHDDDHVDER